MTRRSWIGVALAAALVLGLGATQAPACRDTPLHQLCTD